MPFGGGQLRCKYISKLIQLYNLENHNIGKSWKACAGVLNLSAPKTVSSQSHRGTASHDILHQ
jgi:hypothetical protein